MPLEISIVSGLWAACESISVFAGVIEYQNLSILIQVLEDLILKSLSLRLNLLCSAYHSQASTEFPTLIVLLCRVTIQYDHIYKTLFYLM